MSDHKKALETAISIIDRKYRELDYIRHGLTDLKNRRCWNDIEEVNEFIDNLINHRENI